MPYDLPVIPHGASVYDYHFVISNTNSPYAEFLSVGKGEGGQEIIEEYFRDFAARSPIDILLHNIPPISSEIGLPVVKRLSLACPRIIGIKDSNRDFLYFCTMLAQIKPQRPDFVCFSGTEEILYPSLVMGGDGGTIANSGVMPEVITKLYRDFLAGNHDECRSVQWMIQDLIATMLAAGNFPEGFRAAVSLRGFHPGPPRFPRNGIHCSHG